jgi:two-component sensor histidine kinase/HAMP domain-containing protein/competence protein ComGC
LTNFNTLARLSFSSKLFLSLIVLALVLLSILFLLIIPKMEKEQYEHEIKQVEQTIALNTQQLHLAVKYIRNDGKKNYKIIRLNIEARLRNLSLKLKKVSFLQQESLLKEFSKDLSCQVALIDNSNKKSYHLNNMLNNDGYIQYKNSNHKVNSWKNYIKKHEKNFCPSITSHIVYSMEFDKNSNLLLSCNSDLFYDHENNEEKKIKKYVQKSFSYTNHLHKGNTFLMWLNVKDATNNPLYNKNDKPTNNKYCISKLSDVKSINTGTLSAKDILSASNGKPIIHMLNGKKALTWVRSINNDPVRRLVFLTTVYEEDLYKAIDKAFWKLFPAAIMSFIFAILLGYLLFRKFSKSIDTLVNTSKQVQSGNLKFRSNIKGEDSIGQLGQTFDLMLDSMESNIKLLDLKVEERTQELKNSLDEKNTLLKEIHHRVKNNLAFTISLIKLQKRKVSDKNTKEVLTDIQERVYIMELVHRKLYESKDLNKIPFKKYINELIYDIKNAYHIEHLDIKLNIDDIFLDIEYALPCGLIINECLTNSLKYAFEENSSHNFFQITFKKQDSQYVLEIADNGKGLPQNFDIYKSKSLGLRLIVSISQKQLLGKIDYKNDRGLKYIISFES